MPSLRSDAVLIPAVALTGLAEHWGGVVGVVRVFGAFWVLGGCAMAFATEVPVFFGPQAVARLRGLSKAGLVIPCVLLGACLWVYAPELTCWSTKYRPLCA